MYHVLRDPATPSPLLHLSAIEIGLQFWCQPRATCLETTSSFTIEGKTYYNYSIKMQFVSPFLHCSLLLNNLFA